MPWGPSSISAVAELVLNEKTLGGGLLMAPNYSGIWGSKIAVYDTLNFSYSETGKKRLEFMELWLGW